MDSIISSSSIRGILFYHLFLLILLFLLYWVRAHIDLLFILFFLCICFWIFYHKNKGSIFSSLFLEYNSQTLDKPTHKILIPCVCLFSESLNFGVNRTHQFPIIVINYILFYKCFYFYLFGRIIFSHRLLLCL